MSSQQKPIFRVLSLEDSSVDAELIQHELKRGGVAVSWLRVQTRGDFAREIEAFQPDLILADYRLPDFDGGEALLLAQKQCPQVPFIVISGAVGEETAVELLKTGATDFVLKDRLPRLIPVIHRALREVEERKARQKAEADLRLMNEQLERLVQERTMELRAKNAVMEEDLAMAREFQIAILPHHYPTLPHGASAQSSALKFCNVFRPSSFVSGDFFNVVRVSDTAVGILICDVMGHGVRSALVAGMIRALEEQLNEAADEPGRLLTEINRAMCAILKQTDCTIFATAVYLIIDVAAGRISFANAAHPSPLLVQHNPDRVLPMSTRTTIGPALGIFDNSQYFTYSHTILAGDLILLFTDGLFEVENGAGDIFSEERLRDLIFRYASLAPDTLMHTVFSETEKFANGEAFSDDVCLVGIEIARLLK
ncbi:MAG: fused response regulator/phosphatase [Verrucomicrobiota bacterium]